jgi:hypothetical protein
MHRYPNTFLLINPFDIAFVELPPKYGMRSSMLRPSRE